MRNRLAVLLTLTVLLAACGDDDASTTIAGTRHEVSGYAHAGPVCPVEQTPPDPACADRPVEGAVILALDESGATVASATTAVDGTFTLSLPPGTYRLVPQPVEGLMGTAAEQEVIVSGPVAGIDFSYDTGIR
jgi:hypothetical protein